MYFGERRFPGEGMSDENLLQLEDYEIILTLKLRILDELGRLSEEELEQITDAKMYLLAAADFDMEMQNGGLCQFIFNAGWRYAEFLGDALREIGARSHAQLLEDFLYENGTDLRSICERASDGISGYLKLSEEYPFDDFDQEYTLLDGQEPLEGLLADYIRASMDQLRPI